MSEGARALLRYFRLPALVLLVMAGGLWIFWRHSQTTNMPVADRRLHELYSLEPGEVVRLVPPPAVAERARYVLSTRVGPLPTPYLTLRWDGQTTQTWSMGLGSHALGGVLEEIGINRAAFQIEETLKVQVPGDLIVRYPAPLDEKIKATETILRSVTGRTITVEPRPTEREVIIVTGSFLHRPIPTATLNPSAVHLYADATLDEGLRIGGGSGRVSALLQSVSRLVNRPVIDQRTSGRGDAGSWAIYTGPNEPDRDEKALDQFLKNLSGQTSLTFTREKQVSEMYFVREVK